jgi:L,D-transpeptidase YcbB
MQKMAGNSGRFSGELLPVTFRSLTASTSFSSLAAIGVGAALLAASAQGAAAQSRTAPQAPSQAEWSDRFDSSNRVVRQSRTTVPVLSAQTVAQTELAIQDYSAIVARGGWPQVPTGQRLRLGSRGPAVAALRQRLMASGDLQQSSGASDTFDSYVEGAVKRFQARHGLLPVGVVGDDTMRALNVSAEMRLHQLQTNLVRLRSMSGDLGPRYVTVNIPAAEIEAVDNGSVAARYTGVAGKVDRPSPTLAVKIQEVNFNPTWTVPASIVRKDLIPKMQKDPNYLTHNKIHIYDQANGTEILPEQVNWNSDEGTRYMYRQESGDLNSMGTIRINMPNKDAVYMHDTPSKGLFGENARFFSSGCVRVQNVRELVTWLLRDNPDYASRQQIDSVIKSGARVDVKLKQPVPVYWVYITGWGAADGSVQFRDDIYNRDGVGDLAMQQQPYQPQ